jgi:nucleotide-binding universal stress UspA family protein
VEERAKKALTQAQRIAQRHNVKAVTTTVRSRAADGGIRRAVETYKSDVVVLGVESTDRKVASVFMRTAETLLLRPPCEVIIDSFPS